jgi:hypothetical protein
MQPNSNSLDDYGIELLKQKSDLAGRQWHLTPIMEELYKQKIATDPNKKALYYNVNATEKIKETIDYCIEHDEYLVAECVGVPSSGKSSDMLAIARLLQKSWYYKLKADYMAGKRDDFYVPQIYIGSSVEETQAFFKDARKGDIIFQDEDPTGSGSGINTLLKNINNILSICRETCINFIFVSPEMTAFLGENVTLRLEAISKDYKRRVNRMALYTPNNIALGYVYVHILAETDKLIVRYLKIKRANIAKIKESGGGFSTGFKEGDREEWANKIVDYLINKVGIEAAIKLPKGYIRAVCRWMVKGKTSKDQEDIAYDVGFELQKRYGVYEVEDIVELEEGNLRALQTNVIEDKELLELIYSHIEPTTMHERLGKAWFKYYYIDGFNQEPATEAINEEFKTSYDRSSFLNVFFLAVQQNLLGTAVERAIQEAYYPETKYIAGNAMPDLEGTDFIVEIKARRDNDKRRPLKLIEDEVYLKEYLERQHQIHLVIVSYGKQKCIINTYDLSYSSGENTSNVT